MERITIDPQTVSRLPSVENSPNLSGRKPLILRCLLALFVSYRIDQYGDPEGFKVNVGAVLEGYSDEVVKYVCDPRTGIQRRCTFPPTISEIVDACEDHVAFLERARRPVTPLPKRQTVQKWDDRPQGDLANVFIPEGHPRYASLVEQAQKLHPVWWRFGNASDGRTGVWIPLNLWDGSGIKQGAL